MSETKTTTEAAGSSVCTCSGSFELVGGYRNIIGLRWSALGVLEYCQQENFEKWENGRLVAGGMREMWHQVECVRPNSELSNSP